MEDKKNLEQRLANIESLLSINKVVLNFNEAAQYCGLSRSYFYKLTSVGAIPHYKPSGKMIYFSKAELDTWLLRNAVKTAEAIDKEAINNVVLKRGR